MEAIKKNVYIPSDRKIHLDLTVPDFIDVGEAEVLVVFQPTPKPIPSKRKLGILKGKVSMSNDFDDELPDSFWLGQDV